MIEQSYLDLEAKILELTKQIASNNEKIKSLEEKYEHLRSGILFILMCMVIAGFALAITFSG